MSDRRRRIARRRADYYALTMAQDEFRHEGTKRLRVRALELPGVAEGESCVKRAFKARTKGFLYLGEKDESYNVMLKIGDSLVAAKSFCAASPNNRSIGKTNWMTLEFAADEAPPVELSAWIEESFRLLAPKKLVTELEADDD